MCMYGPNFIVIAPPALVFLEDRASWPGLFGDLRATGKIARMSQAMRSFQVEACRGAAEAQGSQGFARAGAVSSNSYRLELRGPLQAAAENPWTCPQSNGGCCREPMAVPSERADFRRELARCAVGTLEGRRGKLALPVVQGRCDHPWPFVRQDAQAAPRHSEHVHSLVE